MQSELITALITSAIAIVGALTTFIVSWLKTKSVKHDLDDLKSSISKSDKMYFIECPNCKTKIYLKNVEIHEESCSSK